MLISHLDFNHNDGTVQWKKFLEFFESDEVGTPAVYNDDDEPWYATHADVVDKISTMMMMMMQQQQQLNSKSGSDYQGQHHPRLLMNLKQKFESYDIEMTGYVKWEEFAASFKDCSCSLDLEPVELKRLFLALDKHGEGHANYNDLLHFLQSCWQYDSWDKIEPATAGHILKAMGNGAMERYSWLSKLKRKFYKVDHSRTGIVCEKHFLEILKVCGVNFYTQSKYEQLLNSLCETDNNKDSMAAKSLNLNVPYGPVVDFCAKHAGSWQDAYPLLAAKIKDVMLKITNSSCSKPISCVVYQFDKNRNGVISLEDFDSVLHQLGLGDLSISERRVLTELVNRYESRTISYAGVVRVFAEFDPLYKIDEALAVKLLRVLSERLDSSTTASCPEFHECEREDTKMITPAIRREHLKQALSNMARHVGGLSEKELERLVICADMSKNNNTTNNVFVSAYWVLNMFVSGHLGAWVEHLPSIAADLAFQFGLLSSGITAIFNMERLLRIADRGGRTGKCGPVTFKRCLNGAGLYLSDVQINNIMRVTTNTVGGSGNSVTYEIIVNFLRNMCSSSSGFEAPGNKASPPVRRLLEEFHEAVQYAVLKAGGRRINPGSKESYQSLRRFFNRLLDTHGSGFIDLDDLVLALPELGFDEDPEWNRSNLQLMLTVLASQNHGSSLSSGQTITLEEFSSFILKPVVVDRNCTRESTVYEQRQAAWTLPSRNITSALYSDPHQLSRRTSAVRNVKKRLKIRDDKLRGGVSRLFSKAREALENMHPSPTGWLNPSKAYVALTNLLHVEDTLLQQKDWKTFVDTLDQDQTGHIAINDVLCLLFSNTDSNEMEQLTRNKIGDNSDVRATTHRSSHAIAPSMPRALEDKQVRNYYSHHKTTKKSTSNRCRTKEKCFKTRINAIKAH